MLNYLLHIASRYLFTIKQRKVVNIITMVSLAGVLFGTMAMVIVLSVFNGFEDIINKLYQKVDADFTMQSKHGKLFDVDNKLINQINNIDDVLACSEILDHKMLADYSNHQLVIEARGVDKNYNTVSDLHQNIILGQYFDGTKNFVIVGNGVFHKLSLKLLDFENSLKLSFFQDSNTMDLNSSISTNSFYVSGVFGTQVEMDDTHIILNINDLRSFLNIPRKCSSIHIRIHDSSNYQRVEKELMRHFGTNFIIKNRAQQRPFVYKMVRAEKLAVYMIFSFILIISMLSLIASLIVLLMEKQADIQILHALGLPLIKTQNIFLLIGCSITFLGAFLGNLLGVFFCFLQDRFSLIKLGQQSFFLESYPVKINHMDLLVIQFIVLCLGLITSYFVSRNKNFYSNA